METNTVKVTLRMPAALHARLVALARAEQRSLNGEVVYLLNAGASGAATE